MGVSRLGDKKTRKLIRETGLPIVRAWAHNSSHMYEFVTAAHLHGVYDQETHEWRVLKDYVLHFDTCPRPAGWKGPVREGQIFPDGVADPTEAETQASDGAVRIGPIE